MTSCNSPFITAINNQGDITIPLDITGQYFDYTFQKSYLIPNVNDAVCQTFCSVTQTTYANRPTHCGHQHPGYDCVCSGDVIYYAKKGSSGPNWAGGGQGYDIIAADPSGTTPCLLSSGFNSPDKGGDWDCYCQKANTDLPFYNELAQLTSGGATFTIRVDTRTIQSNGLEIMCYQGSGANFRNVETNRFNIRVNCGNVANINDIGGYPLIKEVDNFDMCWMYIEETQVVTLDSSCSITGFTAYHSITDTGLNPAVKVSPYTTGNESENFYKHHQNGVWYFDGHQPIQHVRDHYRDSYFYIQVQQDGGATYWLGGDATPTQFNLFCHPCFSSTISTPTPIEIVVDKYSNSGVTNYYEIPDFYTLTNSYYTASLASNGSDICEPMYFYPFEDLAMTTAWTDANITLSTADAVDTVNKLFPVQSTLSNQKITVKTDISFRKQLYVKGLNSGKQYAALETNVIVCGNEQVIQDIGDFVKVDYQKYRAAGYNSSPSPYFDQPTTQGVNLFVDNTELSGSAPPWSAGIRPWFYTILVDSHSYCFHSKTYKLCASVSGYDCDVAWNSAEQLQKVQMVGNNLQINLTPFQEVELYLLIQYPKGQIFAFRKLRVAVCGLEIVRASNQTQFTDDFENQKILARLAYQYEVGSSTIVHDSSSLPETYERQNFTNMYFYSSNPTLCPMYDCDIVTYMNVTENGVIQRVSPNNRSSFLSVTSKSDPKGLGFELHFDTSVPFYWENFWIRCFTQSTWDVPDNNAYLQVDLQVIDCRLETIYVLGQNEPYNLTLWQNETNPTNLSVGISQKFESSHPLFCPIVSYKVVEIIDTFTNRRASSSWFSSIFIGDQSDDNDPRYWENLVISDSSKVLDFQVFVEASNGNITSNSSICHQVNLQVLEIPNQAPIFFEEPDQEIVVDLNKLGNSTKFQFQFSEIYDENPWDKFDLEIFTHKKIQPLVSFDMESRVLEIKGVTDSLIGEYEFNMYLSDDKEGITAYELTLVIVRPELFEGVVIEDSIFEEDETAEEETVFLKSEVPVSARITNIDQVGNMTIQFSQIMYTSNFDLEDIEQSIKIDLSPYFIDEDFDESLLDFDWHVMSFQGDKLELKLEFENPLYVSMYLVQDLVIVKFINQTNFKSKDFNFLGEPSRTILSQIPKQMFDTVATNNFKIAAEQLDRVLNAIFWLVLIFNLLFQGTESMDHYVLMINSLQIVMHMPFFSSALPGNVIMYLEKTIPIVMFDIIKEDWIINPTNHFLFDEENNQLRTEDPRFPAQIADIGYNSHNFLENVGSVYIFFSIYILRVMFVGLLKLQTKFFNSGHEFYQNQKSQVVFKDLICLFVEGYLEFCLAGYLQWTNLEVDKNQYYGERLSSEIGNVSIFVACVFIPGCFLYMMTRPIELLRENEFNQKYGELYAGMKTESKWTMSYYLVFIIRRVLFLTLAFYAYSNPAQQIQALNLQNLAFAIFVGIVNPRTNKSLHTQELTNELMMQLCSSLLYLFVGDFITDQDVKYLFGFILVLVISMMVVSNLLLVFYKASRIIKMILERYWHRLGRCLDPMYLKPIPKPKKPEIIKEPVKEPQDDLILQLEDLVGEDQNYQGQRFTYLEKDRMVRDQVLQEFCRKYRIPINQFNQQKVLKDFEKPIWQLVQVKKQEIANDILLQKQQLQYLVDKKDLEEWTTEDSIFWLEYGLKLPQYSSKFKSIPLTGHMISKWSEQRLREELNIRDQRHFNKIIQNLNKIQEKQLYGNIFSNDQETENTKSAQPKDTSFYGKQRAQIFKSFNNSKKSQKLGKYKRKLTKFDNDQDLSWIHEEVDYEESGSQTSEYKERRKRFERKQKEVMNLLQIQNESKRFQETQRGLAKLEQRKRQFKF